MTEQFTITYNNKPVSVTVVSTLDNTVFTVHLTTGDIEITAGVDDHGNESWMEDGVHTERAEEIGFALKELE